MSAVNSIKSRELVLVIARDADYRLQLARTLEGDGFDVVQCADSAEVPGVLEARRPVAIVADVQATGTFAPLPTHVDAPLVVIANRPSESTLRSLRARASLVLTKPVSPTQLTEAVSAAVAGSGPLPNHIRSAVAPRMTARSPAMRQLLQEVECLRDSDCPVLILGETGTGKTVLARRIHAIGARSRGPFVDLNCAGLTTDLVESELFGHERGSFTGAHAAKQGLFDVADNGTLFLDEIGDIELRVQPRILKVLEEQRFRRMGDVRERTVDVRLLAATNQDLLGCVVAKTFRADLYYRISTIRLKMPPLRERREDIVPLAMEMLERMGQPSIVLSGDAEQRLLDYCWHGNIRELKNVMESSTLLRRGSTLTADDLRFDLPLSPPPSAPAPRAPAPPLPPSERSLESSSRLLGAEATDATRAQLEREHIRVALVAEQGRVEAAARRLGIARSTLYWKLKRYGLKPNGDAPPALTLEWPGE
jgi:DNA-binding NtrC family response regulator